MKAGLRFGIAAFAAGLALGPLPALAQTAPDPAAGTPATESIGPRELQNFSLNGTVTREAEAPPPTPAQRPPSRTAESGRAGDASTAAASNGPAASAPRRPNAAPPTAAAGTRPATGDALALDFTTTAPATASLPTSLPQPGFSPGSAATPLAPEQSPPLWLWLLLAAAAGAGAAFMLLRRRSREAFAGAPDYDAYVAPEPSAPPRPAPPPVAAPKAEPPRPVGIVSARLRPWLDIAFVPASCIVEEDRVIVEFDVQLTNSGGAPARDILVEASMFNAGPTQEQDIGAFFANPVGQGERIDAIAPLQNVAIRTSLVAPRANIQLFEMGGRQVFVPLVAFNALYRAGSASAQTSSAYLLGRDTDGEKLGPLRIDLGAKAFTRLGVRPLPIGVRN